MRRRLRTAGMLAAAALVGGAVAWALLRDTGSNAPATVSVAAAARTNGPSATTPRAEPAGRHALTLRGPGHPLVMVKRGAHVPLFTAPGGRRVKVLDAKTPYGSRTVLSVVRRRGRWVGAPSSLLPNGELGWVKLDPHRLVAGWTRYEIDVDLSRRAAQLRLGRKVVRSFPVTVGAPATETPTGRFAVTDTFRGGLDPAAYGCCAVATTAIQPHLPSGWLGGNRIAIHGTTGPLGQAISHGCVRAANDDVSALVDRVMVGTPVVIRG